MRCSYERLAAAGLSHSWEPPALWRASIPAEQPSRRPPFREGLQQPRRSLSNLRINPPKTLIDPSGRHLQFFYGQRVQDYGAVTFDLTTAEVAWIRGRIEKPRRSSGLAQLGRREP